MKSDLPMRNRYVIANAAATPESLYLSRTSNTARPEWVRGYRLNDVMLFDQRIDAVETCLRIPRTEDSEPRVVCAWMPSIDEILDSLEVPEEKREDVQTLRGALGDLWVRGVLSAEEKTRQSAER